MLERIYELFGATRVASGCVEVPSLRVNAKGKTKRPTVSFGKTHTSTARFICLLVHGEPPDPSMHAAHSCHNGRCISAEHLRWLTPEDNYAEASAISLERHLQSRREREEARAARQMQRLKEHNEALSEARARFDAEPIPTSAEPGITYKKGATERKSGWIARFSHNGKRYHGGPYYSEAAAIKWRNNKLKELSF